MIIMANFTVKEIVSIIERQRSFIDSIKGLTDEKINWSPSVSEYSKNNTIGIILEHITGAERFLIHQVIFSLEVNRNRTEEFNQKKIRKKDELVQKYESTAQKSKELLVTLTDERLQEIKKIRKHEKSVLWALLHIIEHNNYHIGQINYILAMIKNY